MLKGALPIAPCAVMELLQRYLPLVDDPDAFLAAHEVPLPRVVWANPIQGDVLETARLLLQVCPEAVPLAWTPHAWRLPHTVKPGKWEIYRRGLIHAQEEAALLASMIMEAKPGQRILDMCSSPGNKAAQLGVITHDQATIIANEYSWRRIAPMRFNFDRLGLLGVAITNMDGRRFPMPDVLFDSVLVDAPCSCEGTLRKSNGPVRLQRAFEFHDSAMAVQIGLLRRAVEMTRPGGVIVYATCTYAPEENERVLDGIWPEKAAIEKIEVPEGLHVSPGIAEWEGRTFRSDVQNAIRFWPHRSDTGGFFMAKLRRL